MEVNVQFINMNTNSESKTKAFAKIKLTDENTKDEFYAGGMRVVEGNSGLFVSPESNQGKDGKWHNKDFANGSLKAKISEKVLAAYEEKMNAPAKPAE